ncbi:transposase [Streptomyces chartreusis]|uniref:transposase n=1 Tax=Streptomyces chartreusis TaxID=1969 RepID=UPI00368352AF
MVAPTTRRNTHPERLLTTQGRRPGPKDPETRTGSFPPRPAGTAPQDRPGPVRRGMEAYVHRVTTRSVDDLLKALGADSGISKSEAARSCGELDEELTALKERPLDHTVFPYVFLNATYCTTQANHQIASHAVMIVTGISTTGHREILAPTPASQGPLAEDGRLDSTHRRRANSRHRRPERARPSPRQTRRHPHSSRANPATARRPNERHTPADPRRPQGKTAASLTILNPHNEPFQTAHRWGDGWLRTQVVRGRSESGQRATDRHPLGWLLKRLNDPGDVAFDGSRTPGLLSSAVTAG